MNLKIYTLIAVIFFFPLFSLAQVTVNIIRPIQFELAGDSLAVQAYVTSTYELSSVIASTNGRAATLTYNLQSFHFEGKLSLVGLHQSDTLTLQVTATDYLGNVQFATRKFIYDAPPVLTIESPLNETVARPTMHLKFTCSDIDSCNISLSYNSHTVFSGRIRDSIDKIINLSAYTGTSGVFLIQATDIRQQTTSFSINLYVVTSPFLTEYYEADAKIIDFNYQKILTKGDSILSYPAIIHVPTKQMTFVPLKMRTDFGFLTPFGALIFGADSSKYPSALQWAFDWNAGTVFQLGRLNGSGVTAGNYAIWSGMGGTDLHYRNLSTRKDTALCCAENYNNDLAENGLAVYWNAPPSVIYSYQNGRATIVSDPSSQWATYSPVTDGKNIVYLRQDRSNQQLSLQLYNGQSNVELSNLGSINTNLISYKCNNKFIAYAKLGSSGQAQVWLRDSSGNDTQITFFGDNSFINFLSPNGDIIYTHTNKRFLALRSGHTFEIPNLGQIYYRDSGFYVTIGRSIFKIGPDANLNMCPNSGTTFTSSLTGTNFQWQVDTAGGFMNVINNGNYSGSSTANLNLINVPSSWYGYKYRCLVDGNNSYVYTLKFSNIWTGSVSAKWESGPNWICGSIPDSNTDVIISSGTVEIASKAFCRSITVLNGANVIIRPGATLTVTK